VNNITSGGFSFACAHYLVGVYASEFVFELRLSIEQPVFLISDRTVLKAKSGVSREQIGVD